MNRYADKLEEGMVFKNYKTLCDHLEEEYTTGGRNRKLHEDRWLLCFHWEKQGQKYHITEVHENEIKMENKGNTVFKDVLSIVILNILANSESNPYIKTRKRITTEVGLVNPAFNVYQTDTELRAKFAVDNQYMFFSVDDYFVKAGDNNRNRLKSTLDSLADRQYLLTWKNAYMFFNNEKDNKVTVRASTESEEDTIRDLIRDLLTKMGYDKLNDVYTRGEQDEFYRRLNPLINAEFEIDAYHPVMSINFNKMLVIQYLEDKGALLSNEDLTLAKQRLNNLAVDRTIQLASKHTGTLNEDEEFFFESIKGDKKEESKAIKKFGGSVFRALPDYRDATTHLAEMTIRSGGESKINALWQREIVDTYNDPDWINNVLD